MTAFSSAPETLVLTLEAYNDELTISRGSYVDAPGVIRIRDGLSGEIVSAYLTPAELLVARDQLTNIIVDGLAREHELDFSAFGALPADLGLSKRNVASPLNTEATR